MARLRFAVGPTGANSFPAKPARAQEKCRAAGRCTGPGTKCGRCWYLSPVLELGNGLLSRSRNSGRLRNERRRRRERGLRTAETAIAGESGRRSWSNVRPVARKRAKSRTGLTNRSARFGILRCWISSVISSTGITEGKSGKMLECARLGPHNTSAISTITDRPVPEYGSTFQIFDDTSIGYGFVPYRRWHWDQRIQRTDVRCSATAGMPSSLPYIQTQGRVEQVRVFARMLKIRAASGREST